MKNENKLIGTSLLTAITASLCCITPILVLIAGTSGIVTTLYWVEPFRPYFIGITFVLLGFAWYQKLKSKVEVDCNCDKIEKPKFINSTFSLGIITVFTLVMLAFPYYSGVFYPKTKKSLIAIDQSNIIITEVEISGMTCSSCEEHVNLEVNKLNGVLSSKVSYEKSNAIIQFNSTKTSVTEIEKAINATGYNVNNKK